MPMHTDACAGYRPRPMTVKARTKWLRSSVPRRPGGGGAARVTKRMTRANPCAGRYARRMRYPGENTAGRAPGRRQNPSGRNTPPQARPAAGGAGSTGAGRAVAGGKAASDASVFAPGYTGGRPPRGDQAPAGGAGGWSGSPGGATSQGPARGFPPAPGQPPPLGSADCETCDAGTNSVCAAGGAGLADGGDCGCCAGAGEACC